MGTFLFLFVALGAAVTSEPTDAGLIRVALATGLALVVHPARWLGPAMLTGDLRDASVWIVGPLLGAAVVAVLYRYLLLPVADLARTPGDPTPEDGST